MLKSIGAAEVDGIERGEVRVAYLLGAGATQGCVSPLSNAENHWLVMSKLRDPIASALRVTVEKKYSGHPVVADLVNQLQIGDSGLDIEQLITFVQDSPGAIYADFAQDMREVFERVLRERLEDVERTLSPRHSRLYAALVDMHQVPEFSEKLEGFLTLNYDVFLEHAVIHHLQRPVDYGVSVAGSRPHESAVKVFKMHGSFGWSEQWPIGGGAVAARGFWIPPGIRKGKSEYPFNAIWGLARELLDCDVLRIIGCNLGPNDWDLVSLLFSTRLTHAIRPAYRVEVISDYWTAEKIKKLFPFLEVQWLAELPTVGDQIVGELLGFEPQPFSILNDEDKKRVIENSARQIQNPFHFWLTQMADALTADPALPSLRTPSRVFEEFAETGR